MYDDDSLIRELMDEAQMITRTWHHGMKMSGRWRRRTLRQVITIGSRSSRCLCLIVVVYSFYPILLPILTVISREARRLVKHILNS